ncbi:ABC transporter substrate-binding protein [Arthrobacter sp. CDRTa11]|uniref:ABC transporter substrate-binding protein n=1 Tax=Arthrobacter sp. CDRTa11 TaxID=2651199 RepID=UPI002265E6FC|nr:ABC transporter substrate-binding protein [Arthrobacter sp. CDRTa11]UZX02887.1 ABC transporter substrate-binding protein [Arthrobacter sp. CDRTa11]
MNDLSFFVRASSTLPPERLWANLSEGSASAWPVLEHCGRLRVGETVIFSLPHPDGSAVISSGRIARIQPGRRITVHQETPWTGQIQFSLQAKEAGSIVTVHVQLGSDCLPWFLSGGIAPTPADGERTGPRIGLLLPLSGAAGIMGRAIVNAARMAIDELNGAGAFGFGCAELVVADERTNATTSRQLFERLVEAERCDVVVASVPSASMALIRPAALRRGTLLLSAALSEHNDVGRNVFQFGETPLDQLTSSVPGIMHSSAASNWFILGSDYVWPRSIGTVAQELIKHHRGTVAGIHYQALGSDNFSDVIARLAASDADLILSSLVGLDAVMFQRAFHEAGLRPRFRTLATNFDESVLDHTGRDEAEGIWSTQDYFMPALSDEMDETARRYMVRFGDIAPRLSSMAKAVFDTITLYAQAVQVAKTVDPDAVGAVIRAGRAGGQRLLKRHGGEHLPTGVAEVTASGFRPIELPGVVRTSVGGN